MLNTIVLSNENFYFRDMRLLSSANIAGQKQSIDNIERCTTYNCWRNQPALQA
jgi:hypothetical protein